MDLAIFLGFTVTNIFLNCLVLWRLWIRPWLAVRLTVPRFQEANTFRLE